jgi:hypothetical protein
MIQAFRYSEHATQWITDGYVLTHLELEGGRTGFKRWLTELYSRLRFAFGVSNPPPR